MGVAGLMLFVVLNRVFRLLVYIFFGVVALSLGAVFALMLLATFIKAPGGPVLQGLIRSHGMFPWPVATMFYLGGFAPLLVGVGFVGALTGGVFRYMLFSSSEEVLAEVISMNRTGTTVNGRPQVRLGLRLGSRGISLKTLVDVSALPRPGDRVRLLVNRSDPSFVEYAGLSS